MLFREVRREGIVRLWTAKVTFTKPLPELVVRYRLGIEIDTIENLIL